jgi:hypothetical protein
MKANGKTRLHTMATGVQDNQHESITWSSRIVKRVFTNCLARLECCGRLARGSRLC